MENLLTPMIEQLNEIDKDERFILGVDGLSRSGKSTLVNSLRECLADLPAPVYIFHMDHYIVERKKRYDTGFDEWFEYYHLQWDINWLRHHFFGKLKDDDDLLLPVYNEEEDSHRLENITLPSSCIIIVEGVFLQRKEWKCFFDYIVYLDCPRSERFYRENKNTQQKTEKFKNRYWKAEEYYIETERPIENSDLVLKMV